MFLDPLRDFILDTLFAETVLGLMRASIHRSSSNATTISHLSFEPLKLFKFDLYQPSCARFNDKHRSHRPGFLAIAQCLYALVIDADSLCSFRGVGLPPLCETWRGVRACIFLLRCDTASHRLLGYHFASGVIVYCQKKQDVIIPSDSPRQVSTTFSQNYLTDVILQKLTGRHVGGIAHISCRALHIFLVVRS